MSKNPDVCPKCGYEGQNEKFVKCRRCEFVPSSTEDKWKPANLGKQRGKPKANYDGKN